MAVSDSVTVSMAALTRGMLSLKFLVKRVAKFTSVGKIAEAAGNSSKSSKV
jgi:hypothetical protein